MDINLLLNVSLCSVNNADELNIVIIMGLWNTKGTLEWNTVLIKVLNSDNAVVRVTWKNEFKRGRYV